jgi:DNA-directed RNA polymerase specialized sigma24 family protein
VDAEAEGFAQFVEARQRALQRTAWLLTGDWALAEDLVQTALVRSWPRWERIRRRVPWSQGRAAQGPATLDAGPLRT